MKALDAIGGLVFMVAFSLAILAFPLLPLILVVASVLRAPAGGC